MSVPAARRWARIQNRWGSSTYNNVASSLYQDLNMFFEFGQKTKMKIWRHVINWKNICIKRDGSQLFRFLLT